MTFLDRLAELEMKLSPQKIVNPYEVGMVIEACRRMYELIQECRASTYWLKGYTEGDKNVNFDGFIKKMEQLLTELDGEAGKGE